ncbi:MAG TPA: site-2 protease family protein, partial [Bdellovibrionota bacterium]|nr:site-2 protease family protein [Bdellovibrionota bacterium]
YDPLHKMAQTSIVLNYWLAVFNLIPLPPLDGSKIVESFLSYDATRKYESIAQYSFFILMALLLSGALSVLSEPIFFLASGTANLVATVMAAVFGIAA